MSHRTVLQSFSANDSLQLGSKQIDPQNQTLLGMAFSSKSSGMAQDLTFSFLFV